MEPLDPELQSLVAAERAEVEPGGADRERIGRSLGARVGAGFGVGLSLLSTSAAGATASATTTAGSGLLLKLGAAVVLAGAVAAVAVPASRSSLPPTTPARAAVGSLPAPTAPAPTDFAISEPPTREPPPSEPRSEAPTLRSTSAGSTSSLPPLAEEARLLKQAQQALRDGHPGAALTALAEHQRRFPRGQLALERSAARVQALCGLGRKQQAEREAKAFLQQHAGSGLAAQVRASCGFAAP